MMGLILMSVATHITKKVKSILAMIAPDILNKCFKQNTFKNKRID
jgi:hypothetical protein